MLRPVIWVAQKTVAKGPNFEPGMELHAKQTIFAEGCRGSLTKGLFEKFSLREGRRPSSLWYWDKRTVAGPARETPAGLSVSYRWMANGYEDLRWFFSYIILMKIWFR